MARSHEVFGRVLQAVGEEAAAAEHLGRAADLHAELALGSTARGTAGASPTPRR